MNNRTLLLFIQMQLGLRICMPACCLLQSVMALPMPFGNFCLQSFSLYVATVSDEILVLHMQMGIFQVVYLGASTDEAYQRVQSLQPFTPFRDASCGPPSFNLTVLHCIQVIACHKSNIACFTVQKGMCIIQ